MDDRVDSIIREWHERRPKLDFSPLEVVARVIRASHFLQARLDRIAEAYGLSHTGDLDVLTDLDRAGPPHQRTPSELAETLLLTTGGMTVRLNRLQRAGLIERLPNPRDGRGVLVRLTPIGKELAEDALATLLDTQAASLGTLQPSEQADLATPAPHPPHSSRRHPGIPTRHRSATRIELRHGRTTKAPRRIVLQGASVFSDVLSDVCQHSPGPRAPSSSRATDLRGSAPEKSSEPSSRNKPRTSEGTPAFSEWR